MTASAERLSDSPFTPATKKKGLPKSEQSVKFVFVDSLGKHAKNWLICIFILSLTFLFLLLAYQKDSLANLSKRLDANPTHTFPILSKSSLMKDYSGKTSQKLLSLSRVKQHMPYEILTSVQDLDRPIPKQNDFASSLGIGRRMTDEEFEEFKICWRTLEEEKYGKTMTLKDYLCFYNALDVILLAEVHLSFRNLLYQQYKISPDWFPTLPAFCYVAFLRMLQLSKKKVELIHSEEISNFVLRAKRGGLTQILGARMHGSPGCEDLMRMLKPSFTKYAQDGGILPEDADGQDDVEGEPDLKQAAECMETGGYFPSTLSTSEVKGLSGGWGWRLLYIDANNCESQLIIIRSISYQYHYPQYMDLP